MAIILIENIILFAFLNLASIIQRARAISVRVVSTVVETVFASFVVGGTISFTSAIFVQ